MISLNSLVLALFDYADRDSLSEKNKILNKVSQVLTYLFLAEAFLKILAQGFVLHKNAYLRDGWNVMDFIVVLTG